MSDKKIVDIHPAMAAHMPGLSTWRAMPTHRIEWLDPFLFLNHHGPDFFKPFNRGLPFGPHPHRGFETLTYILDGELVHQDTTGYKSQITKGGVQWMTAGSGLLHSETSSPEFLKNGGNIEIIQLWLNLPKELKMTAPDYSGYQSEDLVHFSPEEGVNLSLISGELFGRKGPHNSITNLTMSWFTAVEGSNITLEVPAGNEVLFYVVSGEVEANGREAGMRSLIQFDPTDKGEIHVQTKEDAVVLFGFGAPFGDPIVAHGPFVMNTAQEINEAVDDYQNGKMGVWKS